MRTAADRAKDRRSFRLECLEDRSLLSVVKASAITAEVRTAGQPAPQHVPMLTGRVVGREATDGLFGGTLPGFTTFSGHGRANTVGNVYLGAQHMQALGTTAGGTQPVSINGGSAVLTTYAGDQIDILYSGSGQATRKGRSTFRLLGSVVSGTFQGTGSVNRSGRFTLDIVVSLTYPNFA